jgi:hypothetical protein
MSLINAGPGVWVVAAAASFVAAIVGFVVGVAWMAFVGAVVGFIAVGSITGGFAVAIVPCFVGAATFGAQAASIIVSANTALVRNLVFISSTPFWA